MTILQFLHYWILRIDFCLQSQYAEVLQIMNRNSQHPRKQPSHSRLTSNKQRARRSLFAIYQGSIERKSSVSKCYPASPPSQFKVKARNRFSLLSTGSRVTTNPNLQTRYSMTHTPLMVEVVYYGTTRLIEFEYDLRTRIHELIDRIKSEFGASHLRLRSGILTVDHALTLGNEGVAEFSGDSLHLVAQDIRINPAIPNSLKHFTVFKCIGSGGFSKVFLAECYGVFMALKLIDKQNIVANHKHSIIQNERDILIQYQNHPFITKLHYSIETEYTITLALQYCSGGELFHLLRKVKQMTEQQARFYFMEVLSALTVLHENGIVYRDLKPENIVIDNQGHIRLADFGLSKKCNIGSVNSSFCGSAQYMAPEMLQRKNHGVSLDIYCLGALLYELITGLPPFFSRSSQTMFHDIVYGQLQFPTNLPISKNAKQIMTNLLSKDPSKRMTADEILLDPWLQGATLEKINKKQFIPPFKPNLMTYNFDDSQFAKSQSDDIVEVYREREAGDLVLPLFRKFYYESSEMKNVKQKLSQVIEPAPIVKRLSLKKVKVVKLRTQSDTNDKSLQRNKEYYVKKRSPLKQRENSSSKLRAKQSSYQRKSWLETVAQLGRGLLKRKCKSPPIKKSYRSKEFRQQFYAR